MHLLNTVTITFAGLMVGNELAVSAFVNPLSGSWRAARKYRDSQFLPAPWVG